MAENDAIAKPIKAYNEWYDKSDLSRTLLGGTDELRRKCLDGINVSTGSSFLPKEEGESDVAYRNRVNRSVLVNVYKRTIQKLTGSVFKNPITVENFDDEIFKWFENIDLQGNDLNSFFLPVFRKAKENGVSHILADFSKTQIEERSGKPFILDTRTEQFVPLTVENQTKLGLRPYLIHVTADQVIGWRIENVNGQKKLTQLRIKEITSEPSGAYDVEDVERVRLLEPGKWELWRLQLNEATKKEEWVKEDEGVTNLNFIPLTTIIFGDALTDMTATPTLNDLADLNLMHFQSTSDQRNILHYARLVTWFGKCLKGVEDGETITIGANKLILSDDPQGDLKAVEHQGAAIEAGRKDIQDLETQMSMFGLTYIMPKTGNITATAKAIDSSENDSALIILSRLFEDKISECIDSMCAFVNAERKDGTIKLKVDNTYLLQTEHPKVLLEAAKEKLIPLEIVWQEFQRRGIIDEDVDVMEFWALFIKQAERETMLGFTPQQEEDTQQPVEDEEEEEEEV